LHDDDPDGPLVARVARGDQDAVRAFVALKLPRMLALAQRMLGDRGEAEEIAQEVFVRVWKHAPDWQPGQARFDTWMHRVALNLCYDRLRARQDTEPWHDEHDAPDAAATPEQALHAAQRGEQVKAALALLPVRQREAIVLQYYQELSNIDTAALMNVSVDALESLLARARRTLRTRLAAFGKERP
jgi:RNA polymerase sigma-70 factor (ECF subfamily)